MDFDDKDTKDAIHEAGHAVAAKFLNVPVRSIGIRNPGPSYAGWCDADISNCTVEDKLFQKLAGRTSEKAIVGLFSWRGHDDVNQAMLIAEAHTSSLLEEQQSRESKKLFDDALERGVQFFSQEPFKSAIVEITKDFSFR